jgi:hypothetical protein
MKNVFLALIAIIVICGCASTRTPSSVTKSGNSNPGASSNSLDYIINGEFAFYLDKRGEDAFYRGYMKFLASDNQNVIFVRSININTGNEEHFMFTVEDDENGYPLTVSNLQGQFLGIEFRQALPDFLNYTSLYLHTRNNYHIQSSIDDEWDDYTLVFSFNKVLPFFGFYDIKMKGENESKYTLLYGGVLNLNNADAFFRLNPETRRQTEESRRVPAIPARNENKVEANGVSITLDDNWRYNDTTNLPGYWLSIDSVRDSQVAIERGKLQMFNLTEETGYMFFKFYILAAGSTIEMDTVTVSEARDGYQMGCYIWERNFRNYQRVILATNGDDMFITNFSSFADIYDANRNYYEKILDSVSVNR